MNSARMLITEAARVRNGGAALINRLIVRSAGEKGKVMFVTTEGGISYPPDGTVRDGKILRVELS